MKKYQAFILLLFIFISCTTGDQSSEEIVVNGEDAIKLMQIEEGFDVQLVAAEPLVVAPVAMNWDEKGRLWVVEMTGYMPDVEGEGERHPNGKIVILEDKDGDGRMDERKVFLDSLVLPRAIAFVEKGILVVEPPALWYYEIQDDEPANKVLVDASYAPSGNVEHQPNALYRAMDNWIYNAEGNFKYRKQGNRWLKEKALMRGQWGISQDDMGRLFYNNNSQNLLGDYFPPAFISSYGNRNGIKGFNERVVEDNRVYPIRPTPGVNRGNLEGVLDEHSKLINFTAASGPVIYRGHLFTGEYYGNGFVAEPAANLIKRNVLYYSDTITGKQAYEQKEFLASTDERFRPVTMYNGPDGALYFADMYRGIIQHKTYLTPYLKEHIVSKGLNYPLNCGRIYRIVPKGVKTEPVHFPSTAEELVNLLTHANGWVRDKAQQILTDAGDLSAGPTLKQLLRDQKKSIIAKYHAAWVLEGINALHPEDIIHLLNGSREERMLACSLFTGLNVKLEVGSILPILENRLTTADRMETAWMIYGVNMLHKGKDNKGLRQLLLKAAARFPEDIYVNSAVAYAVTDLEREFLSALKNVSGLEKMLQEAIKIKADRASYNRQESLAKRFPRGSALYMQICKVCHGENGGGIEALAPALNKSEIVSGTAERFIAVALMGIRSEKTGGEPAYADMPGIWANEDISDTDLAELLSFIRNSWNNDAGMITEEDVKHVKEKYRRRKEIPLTREEMKKGLKTGK